jgi:hypothetical protein
MPLTLLPRRYGDKIAIIFAALHESAIGPKRTSLVAPLRYWGKADMTVCGKSAFAVAIGAKRTWPIAVQVSAFDPKRT